MNTDRILQHPTTVLTPEQREQYFTQGFVAVPAYVPQTWLVRLRSAIAELIDRSRSLTSSDDTFTLDQKHSAERPQLHRITNPQAVHPTFWEFFKDPLMTELAADVVGPDVKFHHSKLNVKSGQGSASFKWHQDIPAWPHTDFSPVTIGIYIDACTLEQGPLAFIPGSNLGELHPMYNADGKFVGIDPVLLQHVKEDDIVRVPGVAGSVILLNCRVIHGSSTNVSDRARPLLLPVYSSADSFPYTTNPLPCPQCGEIVRGQAAKLANFDTRPCVLPPDFRGKISAPWEVNSDQNAPAVMA